MSTGNSRRRTGEAEVAESSDAVVAGETAVVADGEETGVAEVS
jgi:hypothetical protein